MTSTTEQDRRIALLDSLLQITHGRPWQIMGTHIPALQADPILYVHLAAWHAEHGDNRDAQDVMTALLCSHKDAELRVRMHLATR